MSALDIVHKHHNAINAQDEQEYLDSVNFPFTYQNYNTVSMTIKDEEDYRTYGKARAEGRGARRRPECNDVVGRKDYPASAEDYSC